MVNRKDKGYDVGDDGSRVKNNLQDIVSRLHDVGSLSV